MTTSDSDRGSLRMNPPVFVEQDTGALLKVFERRKRQLLEGLGPAEVESIHHVGSTAIIGMPGSPIIDILVFLHSWPPSEAVFKTLSELKYISMGDAPHAAQDKWFRFNDEAKGVQEIGSGALHLVSKDNQESYNKMVVWAEYCNNNKEAFEAYKAIKLEAKDAGSYVDYKKRKNKLMAAILDEAVEWKNQQHESECTHL